MGRHLASRAGIIALASLILSNTAAGRTLDAATDFCTTVTVDSDLGRAMGFVDNVSNNLSNGLATLLRYALASVDQVKRSPERFYYEPEKWPACAPGNEAITVNIRYSGRGPSDPIEARTEIHMPGRPVFKSLHVIGIRDEITSGRVMVDSITNPREAVIVEAMKKQSISIAKTILEK